LTGAERRARIAVARLYLCTGLRPGLEGFLDAVLRSGVDVVQLRDKHASARDLLAAARVFRAACDRAGALFVVNDRADIAVAVDADGVHVGQDDLPPERARALAGPDLLVGLSTHAQREIDAAPPEADYLGVGPVNETPTKPGRAGTGLELVRYAAANARAPFFVTGGMDASTIGAARGAGARGFVVVRAITEAPDPGAAARAIRAAIDA
jgi:thiamine-phosphate pyrophosphorylase